MIAVYEWTFHVIADSENATEMLDLTPQSVPTLERASALTIGTNVRSLFTPWSALLLGKVAGAREIML